MKYIRSKTMIPHQYLKESKIILYGKHRLLIEYYMELRQISKKVIVIDNIIICGENLILSKLDGYILEIEGVIHHVKFE